MRSQPTRTRTKFERSREKLYRKMNHTVSSDTLSSTLGPTDDIAAALHGDSFEDLTKHINTFGIPVIIFVGLIGNSLSLAIFLGSHLKIQSSIVYLVFLNASDNLFLLCLGLGVWLGWIRVYLIHKDGWCQIIVYLTYVSSFLSTWIVVCFTVERFIVVFYPLKRHILCSRSRAIRVGLGFTGASFLGYLFILGMTGMHQNNSRQLCMTYPHMEQAMRVMSTVDSVITLAIPSLAIVLLNLLILIKIWRFVLGWRGALIQNCTCGIYDPRSNPRDIKLATLPCRNVLADRNKGARVEMPEEMSSCLDRGPSGTIKDCGKCRRDKDARSRSPEGRSPGLAEVLPSAKKEVSKGASESSSSNTKSRHCRSRHEVGCRVRCLSHCGRRNIQLRTTRYLVIVSSVFVALNLPSHALRLHVLVAGLRHDSPQFSPTMRFWQQMCQILSYMNFCLNFFLYAACNRQFRFAFGRVLQMWWRRIRNIHNHTAEVEQNL